MSKGLGTVLEEFGHWFERGQRVLPWRETPSLYRVWISEIMLQQTQVVTVIPYFENFMRSFPSVEKLAESSEEQVMAHWAGLGYYSRARNLHRGAKQIVAAGKFPATREEWLEIPGVGPYTAGAIVSISLDHPVPILDGNVERVVSRVRRVGGIASAERKQRLWRLSEAFVSQGFRNGVRPSVMNQALMELGATVCTPRSPRCGECPIQPICRANARGDAEAYPPTKRRGSWKDVREEVHCVIGPGNRLWLAKSGEGSWRSGLWDFPSDLPTGALQELGKVETKHVVTRHRITRVTRVWKWLSSGGVALRAADSSGNGSATWVDPEAVPTGAAFKKAWTELQDKGLGLDSPENNDN